MHSSVGVYILTIVWCICLVLCWVSVRTGSHYIGKLSVIICIIITITLILLPRGQEASGANFYDGYFVPRFLTLIILLISIVVGAIGLFVYVLLPPVETQQARYIGKNN